MIGHREGEQYKDEDIEESSAEVEDFCGLPKTRGAQLSMGAGESHPRASLIRSRKSERPEPKKNDIICSHNPGELKRGASCCVFSEVPAHASK